MKTRTDTERFARYQSVVNLLLTKDSFYKPDIYESLDDEEKAFIGRVINELVQDGYLTQNGLKSKPLYLWSEKKDGLDEGRWIDNLVFTATVKRSPWSDRPREMLLEKGTEALSDAALLAILLRTGRQGQNAIALAREMVNKFGMLYLKNLVNC